MCVNNQGCLCIATLSGRSSIENIMYQYNLYTEIHLYCCLQPMHLLHHKKHSLHIYPQIQDAGNKTLPIFLLHPVELLVKIFTFNFAKCIRCSVYFHHLLFLLHIATPCFAKNFIIWVIQLSLKQHTKILFTFVYFSTNFKNKTIHFHFSPQQFAESSTILQLIRKKKALQFSSAVNIMTMQSSGSIFTLILNPHMNGSTGSTGQRMQETLK